MNCWFPLDVGAGFLCRYCEVVIGLAGFALGSNVIDIYCSRVRLPNVTPSAPHRRVWKGFQAATVQSAASGTDINISAMVSIETACNLRRHTLLHSHGGLDAQHQTRLWIHVDVDCSAVGCLTWSAQLSFDVRCRGPGTDKDGVRRNADHERVISLSSCREMSVMSIRVGHGGIRGTDTKTKPCLSGELPLLSMT